MTINIELPYLGILAVLFILAPLICTLVTLETEHHATRTFRRDMDRREKALKEGTITLLKSRKEISDRDAALDRRMAEFEKWCLAQRETIKLEKQELEQRTHELGRAAHDMAIQAKMAVAAHDTMPSIPKLEA